MMKAYVIHGHANDLYAYRTERSWPRCAACGWVTDKWDLSRLSLKVPTTLRMDVSMTYDGLTVVSERFVRVYETHALTGLVLWGLNDGFRALTAPRRVAFDANRRRTRFEDRCSTCNTYGAVAGATPAFLRPEVRIAPREFVWTDIEFGSGDERRPLLVCGAQAAMALEAAGLRGLDTLKEVRT